MRLLSVFSITCIVLLVLSSSGCGGSDPSPLLRADGSEIQLSTPNWPASLPVDNVQPWEVLDARGYVVLDGRRLSCINADSTFVPGVERAAESAVGVSDNGEACHMTSGSAGSGDVSWAWWRLTMGGEQPGVVSADVNLLPMSDGAQSEYFIGLSNYGAGSWEWRGPLRDNHARFCVSAGEYLSGLGNLFLCVVAGDGAVLDVVVVAANACDEDDSTPPPAPSGLAATAVAAGLELSWDAAVATDLAGYCLYYSSSWFLDKAATGVLAVPGIEGTERHVLPADQQTYVRVAAIDLSGNESALSEIASADPLAGEMPDIRLVASQPSGLTGAAITLTASGADEFDWDLDGDGSFELSGDTTGMQAVDTSRPGLIRPAVRGLNDGGSSRACSGVSVLIGSNSRPLATAYADPASGPAPLDVTFTGTGEDDDGTIVGYAWDLDGDGTYDYTHATEPNPPVQQYDTPGTYNVKFRVEDNLGLTDVDTVAVNVSDPLNAPPTADLAVGVGEERGNPPHTVNFDAGGSTDSDGTIVEYLWDFDGDGHYDYSSTVPAAVHTYAESGVYTAAVRVEDDQGAQDTAALPVEVNYAPVADLDADVTIGDPPLLVSFDAGGSSDPDGTIDDYEWDLDGDGVFNESGDEADAQGSDTANYTYSSVGLYDAKVRVTDNEGMQDTATIGITARGWLIIVVEGGGHAGENTSLMVVDGCPAIAYAPLTGLLEYKLKYARASTAKGLEPEDWKLVTVDADGSVGNGLCMAVVDGCPAIAYVDQDNNYVKYARATTSTGDSASDWTQRVTVDSSGHECWGIGMAVVDGCPAIAYDDDADGDVKYARATTSTGGSASDWTQRVSVDSGGVGYDCTLAVIDGCPAISYYDFINGDLKYARATTSTGGNASDWTQIVTVDSTGNVGRDPSLATIAGCPAIGYYHSGTGDLKYARATTSTGGSASDWTQIVTVDSTGDVGPYTWLAVVDGCPAISYFDSTNRDLKYARATTSTGGSASDWTQITVVDSTGMVGPYTSLALVDGSPAISYGDWDSDNLKYAYYVQ